MVPAVLLALAALSLAQGAQAQETNTICPVMKLPIDKTFFTEYKGKTVYFCCNKCKSAFAKDPEKYVANLPQFAASAPSQGPGLVQHEHDGHGFSPAALIEPMGIVTLSLVASTVCLGLLRRLKPRPLLTIHKICGVCALVSGATHAILVLIAHSH